MTQEELAVRLKAGQIKRYHTEPTIKQETVAEHSFGVAQLVLYLTDNTPGKLIIWALNHDVSELSTGDVPANVKWAHPFLNAMLHAIEEEFEAANNIEIKLSDEQKTIAKWADLLQMAWYCLQERRLGNTNVDAIFWRINQYFAEEIGYNKKGVMLMTNFRKEYNHVSKR